MAQLFAIVDANCHYCAFLKHVVNFSKNKIQNLNALKFIQTSDVRITDMPPEGLTLSLPLLFIQKNNTYTFLDHILFLKEIFNKINISRESGFVDYINSLPGYEREMCRMHPLFKYINEHSTH
ncbi:hypothetical protein DLEV_054 [Diachasmimorpha longicaudata entomopoxvirus]|uniref:Uncharacterized protein n=1 Tax=Diachasmimorpha longicaudata entomopoxvirus TaxID=109981 RepID=A0A7R5WF54_9POXV|nr:hypothetical protein QKK69_gp054 [Diachasmimorpha longicaudata entomopoxvirus]AKS26345.1 hypothetical protein DLEV_054 [Diachasmimorpha longicaudata entomopoxvirus]